ncbi:hypothetical protein BS78_09G097900 [Paspalum vaginatum]|nr:hypothetical protein BS78_09G097900 [Paspalum vaginatum]
MLMGRVNPLDDDTVQSAARGFLPRPGGHGPVLRVQSTPSLGPSCHRRRRLRPPPRASGRRPRPLLLPATPAPCPPASRGGVHDAASKPTMTAASPRAATTTTRARPAQRPHPPRQPPARRHPGPRVARCWRIAGSSSSCRCVGTVLAPGHRHQGWEQPAGALAWGGRGMPPAAGDWEATASAQGCRGAAASRPCVCAARSRRCHEADEQVEVAVAGEGHRRGRCLCLPAISLHYRVALVLYTMPGSGSGA